MSDDSRLACLEARVEEQHANFERLYQQTLHIDREVRSLGLRLDAKIDDVAVRLRETMDRLDQRIDDVAGRLGERMDRLDQKIDGVALQLDHKIDGLDHKFDRKFDDLRIELSKHFRWTVGLMVTTMGLMVTLIGLVAGLLTTALR
jgi:hypothetical protein